jgi:alpha-D-xyloside xylohydrolase
VQEVLVAPRALTVYAGTRPVTNRGATLNQALLTIRYSSPLPNVIRVQMVHHKGGRPRRPSFALEPQPEPAVVIRDGEDAAALTSGRLTVRVQKRAGWLVEFQDEERVITSRGWRAAGFVDTPDGRFIHEQLSLAVGECVYGLGERFTPFVKNGQVVDLWNEDGGTSSEQVYKNVPSRPGRPTSGGSELRTSRQQLHTRPGAETGRC